jgi:undecaprenyl-diphosphatase
MTLAGSLGRGFVGSSVGLLLLAHGFKYNNRRTKRAGIAVLVALIIAATAAELLKHVFLLPRPKYRAGYGGFPSGHASAAFALASVLGTTFATQSPLFYFLAALTGISRLYFRAHFIGDVVGGAVVGLLSGIPIAGKLIPSSEKVTHGLLEAAGWVGAVAISAGGLVFFHSVEKNIETHLLAGSAPPASVAAMVDFGAPEARPLLGYGWSRDELWFDGRQSVVWATGLSSALTANLPAMQDYRVRLRVFPYSPKGPACQQLEVKVNHRTVTKFLLEQGWHWYEFTLPKAAAKAGNNEIQFFYDYAESPKSRHRAADERRLSVAFDQLEFFPERR